MKQKVVLVLLIFFGIWFFIACDSSSQKTISIQNFEIHRYEQALFSIDQNNFQEGLKSIQTEYSFFLNGNIEDPANSEPLLNFVQDTFIYTAYRIVSATYNNLDQETKEIESMLIEYKSHFPEQNIPEVFSYVSGYDYFGPVQFYDSVLLIALDMYLGADFQAYKQLGIPNYVLQDFDRKYLTRDCAFELSGHYATFTKDLLESMILAGKRLFFVKSLLPEIKPEILFKYDSRKYIWADKYEDKIWAFLIENELLYSREKDIIKKLISPAPYTAYFGEESPPLLGNFIGFRIVESYMKNHPELSLKHLMEHDDAVQLLNESYYHP